MSDLRSPLAKARDEWMESEEGIRCLDSRVLFNHRDAQYLRNRLETAFIAGADWAVKHFVTPTPKEGSNGNG